MIVKIIIVGECNSFMFILDCIYEELKGKIYGVYK